MSIHIIIEAKAEPLSLESLQDAYDRSRSEFERERIAAQIYEEIGGKIRSMIQHRAKGLKVNPDQLDALAWEGLLKGLNDSGMTRFKLSSAQHSDWQPAIQAMLEAVNQGRSGSQCRIWSMLSPQTRAVVLANPQYVKTSVQNGVLADINGILRRRDLYDPAAWSGLPLPDVAQALLKRGINNLSGSELTCLNAHLVASALPGLSVPPSPARNLMGYISASIIPKMQPAIFEAATGRRSDTALAEAAAFLRPDIEAIKQMEATGTLPDEWEQLTPSQRIYQHQKRRLAERYNRVLAWYDAHIRELQPQRPFVVNSPASLRDARALFEQHPDSVRAKLWKTTDAPYYVPSQALQPFGIKTIERLLASERSFQGGPANQEQSAPSLSTMNAGDVDAAKLLSGGHSSRAYQLMVGRLFDPEQAEYQIGMFLAQHPTPTQSEIEYFMTALPESLADDIEGNGWNRTVYEIDNQILQAIKDPAMRAEVVHSLGDQPQAVIAALDRARCNIFIRTSEYILKSA